MTERTPWWKVFLPKRKPGTDTNYPFGPDFDPFAQRPDYHPNKNTTGEQTQSKGTSLLSDETYDDSQMESVFSEQKSRRMMKWSRSGRCKVANRNRTQLPETGKETENAWKEKEETR